jgi:CDP-diacylglycerol---glycerol-3-phosphate 3-phosphatidyltransferase
MFDGRWRSQIEAGLKPMGNSLKRSGVSADALTCTGIVMAVAASVAIGSGALQLGLLLVILTGIPDLLDGAVAKASGKATLRGAFFDSVSDRLTDGLLFGGLTWYLVASDGRPWVAMLPVAGYVSASVVSYIRAKADALGFDARGGLVERAERFVLICVGLLFEPLLLWVLALIVVLNTITAAQRFVKVWIQATNQAPVLTDRRRRRPRRPERTMTDRWQARAESRQRTTRRPGH